MTTPILERIRTTLGAMDGIHVQPAGEVLQVIVEDQEEFPIVVSETNGELICMVHLFAAGEIRVGAAADLHEDMLAANLALPLSTFGKIGDRYVLFGSLSATSEDAVVEEEIETLATNTVAALELVEAYLA